MLPRFVVGAPKGRSGKTTLSIAIGRALSRRGFSVQPFKKGPDYIDPSWLTLACGRSCSNLDTFIMPEEALPASFGRRAMDADLTLIEGAMGLFDSPEADGLGSVAWLARLLKAPVILVVNAERMTRSIAALVSGYQHFEPETHIAAVILNNVSGVRHRDKLVNAVESHCGIPVVGAVPSNPELTITERHLGLTPSAEKEQAESVVATICEIVEKHLDLDAILTIAKGAPELSIPVRDRVPKPVRIARVGVMRDRVFSFYYPENLEALSDAGVEVVPLDVLAAHELPDLDGLYIGGGFPELYASQLEANSRTQGRHRSSHREGSSDLCGMRRIDVPLPGDQMAGQTLRDGRHHSGRGGAFNATGGTWLCGIGGDCGELLVSSGPCAERPRVPPFADYSGGTDRNGV